MISSSVTIPPPQPRPDSEDSPRQPQYLPAPVVTDDYPDKCTNRDRIEEERKGKKRQGNEVRTNSGMRRVSMEKRRQFRVLLSCPLLPVLYSGSSF